MSFQFSKQEDKQVSEGYLEAIHAFKSHPFSNQIIILFNSSDKSRTIDEMLIK